MDNHVDLTSYELFKDERVWNENILVNDDSTDIELAHLLNEMVSYICLFGVPKYGHQTNPYIFYRLDSGLSSFLALLNNNKESKVYIKCVNDAENLIHVLYKKHLNNRNSFDIKNFPNVFDLCFESLDILKYHSLDINSDKHIDSAKTTKDFFECVFSPSLLGSISHSESKYDCVRFKNLVDYRSNNLCKKTIFSFKQNGMKISYTNTSGYSSTFDYYSGSNQVTTLSSTTRNTIIYDIDTSSYYDSTIVQYDTKPPIDYFMDEFEYDLDIVDPYKHDAVIFENLVLFGNNERDFVNLNIQSLVNKIQYAKSYNELPKNSKIKNFQNIIDLDE